ncbi:protein TolR [Cognatilysobacter lacus]|uniref:Tol-Pal system protein TolR n=1 Tax=Cognatilysobacter lacus TaxID=1643323 RepID=A0A5D8YDW0_9GAMM|nr:protein TolR [Lysobacter lacus]TZF80928.1 protein TolR [Lysobacter lacus]
MSLSVRRHRRRKLKSEINVVPYIDVMLVLLVIFMITAPLLNLGVDVDLPKSNAKSLQQKTDPVVVQVDAAGNYFLAVKAGSNERVSRDELRTRLAAIVAQNPQSQVLIGADAKASYQTVTDAIDVLKLAHVDKVSLISAPKSPAK